MTSALLLQGSRPPSGSRRAFLTGEDPHDRVIVVQQMGWRRTQGPFRASALVG